MPTSSPSKKSKMYSTNDSSLNKSTPDGKLSSPRLMSLKNPSPTQATPTRSTPDRSNVSLLTPSSIYDTARIGSVRMGINGYTYNKKRRICFCDQNECPSHCNQCDLEKNVPCEKHIHIPCSILSCRNIFHKECLASINQLNSSSHYKCIECTNEHQSADIIE